MEQHKNTAEPLPTRTES